MPLAVHKISLYDALEFKDSIGKGESSLDDAISSHGRKDHRDVEPLSDYGDELESTGPEPHGEWEEAFVDDDVRGLSDVAVAPEAEEMPFERIVHGQMCGMALEGTEEFSRKNFFAACPSCEQFRTSIEEIEEKMALQTDKIEQASEKIWFFQDCLDKCKVGDALDEISKRMNALEKLHVKRSDFLEQFVQKEHFLTWVTESDKVTRKTISAISQSREQIGMVIEEIERKLVEKIEEADERIGAVHGWLGKCKLDSRIEDISSRLAVLETFLDGPDDLSFRVMKLERIVYGEMHDRKTGCQGWDHSYWRSDWLEEPRWNNWAEDT